VGDEGGEDDLACGSTYGDEEDKGEDFGRVNRGNKGFEVDRGGNRDDGGFADDKEDEGFKRVDRGAFILACCNTAADLDSS
jgi:hypothetical protein